MKGTIFKKAFLLGGILLLTTLVLAQLSWGCDDDKWACDDHDKWDCHKCGKPCQPPKIQRVFLDYKPDSETFIRFSIWGKNFDNGVLPVVALGGIFDNLDVKNYSNDYIVATLPISEEEEFEFGDYRLVVSTCHDSTCNDKICKDHGPNCKCKYCKEHCAKCKDKNCRDDERKGRCKDRYALTIAGPPSPPSAMTLKIESKTIDLPLTEGIFKIEDNVECGSGFRATGGGFACPECTVSLDFLGLRILVSEPFQDDKKNGIGWRVVGAYTGIAAKLTIHAICAAVQ